MKIGKKILLLCILLSPLLPYMYKNFLYRIPHQLLSERNKIETNQLIKSYSIVIDFFNELKGRVLVMRQGDLLNYTGVKILNIEDNEFFDIFSLKKDFKNLNYIALNYYNNPVMYHPQLENILYDPHKSQLIFDFYGWKVFKLRPYQRILNNTSFNFNISRVERPHEYPIYTFVSHQSDSPDLAIMPRVEDGDFPFLKPGLYDFICEMDVATDKDTEIKLAIYPFSSGEHYFYLKKGKNRLLARFLHSHKPFRLILMSKNPNIHFHKVNMSYNPHAKLVSSENMLLRKDSNLPLIVDCDGNSKLKICGTELLIFEKPFSKGDTLKFMAKGYGSLIVTVSPFNLAEAKSIILMLGKWNFPLAVDFFRFLPVRTYEYSLSHEYKNIQIPFKKEAYAFISVNSGTVSKKSNFTFRSFSITKEK